MRYNEKIKKEQEIYQERFDLVVERLQEIAANPEIEAPFADYFKELAQMAILESSVLKGQTDKKTAVIKQYSVINDGAYDKSYANPSYAKKLLGEDYYKVLCEIYTKVLSLLLDAAIKDMQILCIYFELVVEIYNYFENKEELSPEAILEAYRSFKYDNLDIENAKWIDNTINKYYDPYTDLVMNADLSNTDYLYEYGMNFNQDAVKSAEYLNTFSDEEIKAMATTLTEGFRIGFASCSKPYDKKDSTDIRFPLGFERMARQIGENYKEHGKEAIFRPYPFMSSSYSGLNNKQLSYDHKEHDALFFDKHYVEHELECMRNYLETLKESAPKYAGPTVIEVFGEQPFAPEQKDDKCKYNEEQQKLSTYESGQMMQLLYKYINGDERSFTIIAYPVPSIGEKYEEIFAETVKLNTLDYNTYQTIQQKIIDALDTADKVHVVGTNGNKTDLYVNIWDLKNPEKETAFENCVADINIPVGEVFTSPVLEGTNGKLHVSQVYLNELNFLNLEIDFKDGMIDTYTCTNFDSEEKNKEYIFDNILFHHETLPIGEFAIGTNTTAYKMARVYDIAAQMPILIAEKTGPHFAVGDTCYSFDEDNVTYNPDGKSIVARENSCSALRKEDPSKAYFSCHTDITIPYDELGAITVIKKDGTSLDIIRDGRFVLPGTEELNVPLDEYDSIKNK